MQSVCQIVFMPIWLVLLFAALLINLLQEQQAIRMKEKQ